MERDPLLEDLRALKAHTPDPGLTERVSRAALAALANEEKAAPAAWRRYLELALYQAAIPTALAGATVLYLSWAVSAASHLY
jgi:hypothetical protein